MKLLEKKDVFEQKRIQEQEMVIKGAQISDLVQKHQKKLNEAKEQFVSEVEKQKELFDEMVGHYTEKIKKLKDEVANLVNQREKALHPLFVQEEKLKVIQDDISTREASLKAKSELVEAAEIRVAEQKQALDVALDETKQKQEEIMLNFLNTQKKLDQAKELERIAKINTQKTDILLEKTQKEIDLQRVDIQNKINKLEVDKQEFDVIKQFVKEREAALKQRQLELDERAKQIMEVYESLQKAVAEHQSKL